MNDARLNRLSILWTLLPTAWSIITLDEQNDTSDKTETSLVTQCRQPDGFHVCQGSNLRPPVLLTRTAPSTYIAYQALLLLRLMYHVVHSEISLFLSICNKLFQDERSQKRFDSVLKSKSLLPGSSQRWHSCCIPQSSDFAWFRN